MIAAIALSAADMAEIRDLLVVISTPLGRAAMDEIATEHHDLLERLPAAAEDLTERDAAA